MDEKIENLLNISMGVLPEEREGSYLLNSGYNTKDHTWEVIVKYTGNIEGLLNRYPDIRIDVLLNNYAIITAKAVYIDEIAKEDVINYMEKPKPLYYQLIQSNIASCTFENSIEYKKYKGQGVIVAVLDSGIDVFDKAFMKDNNETRIISYWDQSDDIIYDASSINRAIYEKNIIGIDVTGHGTNVAKIACGNQSMAPLCDIVAVKLKVPKNDAFPRTVELMKAIDYVVRLGIKQNKPVAINISIGNNYGAHDGSSILENYIDEVYSNWKIVICIGTGNEGTRGIHYGNKINSYANDKIELAIGNYETNISIWMWKNYFDEINVKLTSPAGDIFYIKSVENIEKGRCGNTNITGFMSAAGPYSKKQEIFFNLYNMSGYIDSGIWIIEVDSETVKSGEFNIWLPSAVTLNEQTGFLKNTSKLTFTIPSTASKAISVGAYNAKNNTYAEFSGRGYVCFDNYVKPELVAPGYDIEIDNQSLSGTSFATPFVTAACAALMSYGLENDLYMYGEKVKAYLIKGAKPLSTRNSYPDSMQGYGTLCLLNKNTSDIL